LSNKTASLLPETCTDTAVIVRLRELGTAEIGKLTAVMGVVTRTSEVRPELLQGTFKCLECGNVVKNVEQQFKYTEVLSLHIIHFYFSSMICLMMDPCLVLANNMHQRNMPEPIELGPSPAGEQIHRLAACQDAGDIKRDTCWIASTFPGCHSAT
jgi:hypothetical protein